MSVKNVIFQKNITLLMFKSSSSVLAVRKINLPAPRVASGANWIWETGASPLFTISTKNELNQTVFLNTKEIIALPASTHPKWQFAKVEFVHPEHAKLYY